MTRNELLQIANPILFNTEMVQAIIKGYKTQTRRIVPERVLDDYNDYDEYCNCVMPSDVPCMRLHEKDFFMDKVRYHEGDILYVRETWNYGYIDSSDSDTDVQHWFEPLTKHDSDYLRGISGYVYCADFTEKEQWELGTEDENGNLKRMPWKPSIHMPKEAARIFLKVTDVRVERLQDITAEDIRSEGLTSMAVYAGDMTIASQEFAQLWDSTVKKSDLEKFGWKANPWVYVYEFSRIEIEKNV